SRFWVNVVLTALRDNAGELKGFSAVTRDVTEQRHAREALEYLQLQREMILNSAGDGICGLDQEGRCTFINPAGARMLGRQPEELAGKRLHDVLHAPNAESTTRCLKEDCELRAALQGVVAPRSAEDVFFRGDGTSVMVDSVITPIRSDDGRIRGAVLAFRDMTERRTVERMKDEFISVVSHELRTPLTAIRGSLGLLASGRLCENPGRCQRMAALGVASADRLVRLVNDILDLERIESGHVTMEKKLCDPVELMNAAADLMRDTAAAWGIKLSLNAFSTELRADPDRIIQVLINLLGNAIKFSARGGRVHMTAECRDGEVLFEVADHGRGIPASSLSRIFERFHQVDASDSREKGGTGLGLAISKTIVMQHGG
ncbi:MAG: PAS domain-containing sensor histidine kinase, partial [Terriglobia bacterium]